MSPSGRYPRAGQVTPRDDGLQVFLTLPREAAVWASKVQSRASKLLGPQEQGALGPTPGRSSPLTRLARQGVVRRQLSNQSHHSEDRLLPKLQARRLGGPGGRRQGAPLGRSRSKEQEQEVREIVIQADLKGVSADLMTSKFRFANLNVENLKTRVEVSASKTKIVASLREVRITDLSPDTLYQTLVESQGQEVFNVKVELYEGLTRYCTLVFFLPPSFFISFPFMFL